MNPFDLLVAALLTRLGVTGEELAAALALFGTLVPIVGNLLVLATRKRFPAFAVKVRRAIPFAVAFARPELPTISARIIAASETLDPDHPVRAEIDRLRAELGQ